MDEVMTQIGAFLGNLDWIGGVIKLRGDGDDPDLRAGGHGLPDLLRAQGRGAYAAAPGAEPHRLLGLLQWVADAVKLMTKEDFAPGGTDRIVFLFAPVLSMFTATAAYAFIPFGQDKVSSTSPGTSSG